MNTRTKTILTTGSLGLMLAGTGAGVATAATPTIAAPTESGSTTTSAPAGTPDTAPAATPAAAPAATPPAAAPAKDSPAATPTPAVTPPAATPTPAVTPPAATPTPAVTPPAAAPTPAAPSQGQNSKDSDSKDSDSKDSDSQEKGELKGLEHGEFTVHTKTGDKVIDIQGGEVSAVDPGSVTVKSTDGFTATYTLNPTTKVERNKEATTPAQITTNDRVRVVADKSSATNNTATATATTIRIGDTEAAK